jgi:hypothetical protein
MGFLVVSVLVSYWLAWRLSYKKSPKSPSDHVRDIQMTLLGTLLITYVFSKHWGHTALLLPLATIMVTAFMNSVNYGEGAANDTQKRATYAFGIAVVVAILAVLYLFSQQPYNVLSALAIFCVAGLSIMVGHAAGEANMKYYDLNVRYKIRTWFIGLLVALMFSVFDGFAAATMVSTGLALFVQIVSTGSLTKMFV